MPRYNIKTVRNSAGGGLWQRIVFITLAILLGYGIFIALNKAGDAGKAEMKVASVNVAVAAANVEDVANKLSLVGTVYAYETVALKSRLDSQIISVNFRDGDVVEEGEMLFELDDSVLKAQLNQNIASLKRDEAQLENARKQYERYRKLAALGFASSEKMQDALMTMKTQSAAVNASKAAIDSVKAQVDFTTIIAPISGRAGTINVTRGNTVKANDAQPLVIINRVKPIRVQFAMPQRYYDILRNTGKGDVEVTAVRSSDGQAVSIGKLEYIDNLIDSSTGSFNASALFENDDEKLWPGMFVNVSITLDTDKAALVIPQVAVQNSQEGYFVFVVDSEGKKAARKAVQVQRMQDDKAVIKSGLVAGERVVIDGLLKLSDGAAIEISAPLVTGIK